MSEEFRSPPVAGRAGQPAKICRLCEAPLSRTFVDLGMSPLCESFLTADQVDQMEPYFPLHVLVCDGCFLVQLQEYVEARAHLHGVRLLLVLLDVLGRARAQILRA